MNSDFFEERAAIAEYDAGMTREKAEAWAAKQEALWAEQKFRGEVRQFLKWKAADEGQSINRTLSKRKEPYRSELINACREQWERGNRGEKGDWRE